MANNFDPKITPEQLNLFNSNISKAKDLTERQTEIVKEVIDGEIELGKLKIAYLNEYFDTYLSKLDQVARKGDALSDVFQLIANASRDFETKPITIKYQGGDNSSGSSKSTQTKKANKSSNDYPENFKGEDLDLGLTEEQVNKQKAHLNSIREFVDQITKQSFTNLENQSTEIENKREKLKKAQLERLFNLENNLTSSLAEIQFEQSEKTEDRILELRLQKQNTLQTATAENLKLENSLNAEILSSSGNLLDEAVKTELALDAEKEKNELLKKMEKQRIDFIAKEELAAKKKNNGILTDTEVKRILREANTKFSVDKANLDKLKAERLKQEEEIQKKAAAEAAQSDYNLLYTGTAKQRKEALKQLTTDENGDPSGKKIAALLVKTIGDYAKKLEHTVDEIGAYQAFIDTRLQGSSNKKNLFGSYWGQLSKDMMSVGAVNPYYSQKAFADNIKDLVNQGIAFDLKQRAFLKTIQEKIANTFDAADGTLLRLIRLQQEDSTAGRLGMESALNTFLNSMYENTEYLNSVAKSVRGSLEEMESLVSGTVATEIEYQVQKWMGSLFSVGMSQEAVTSIANTYGQIAAGQIEGLTNGGTGNLLIMAANDAGISIAEMLTQGLDASDTNKLLNASVNYLAEIAESSADNRVVQQQLANVFGVKASDLRAATNLTTKNTMSDILNHNFNYDQMLTQLYTMAGSMGERTSMGEKLSNIWENVNYSLASSMAINPVTYFIYKMAGLLDKAIGGFPIPFVTGAGTGVDLETTVSDLMRTSALGFSILGSFPSLISGLANSMSGRAMLNTMGIRSGSGLTVTPRGPAALTMINSNSTASTSESGYVGNAAASDIKNSTLQQAEDSKKSLMVEAMEEQDKTPVDEINTNVLKIYKLLDDVVHGTSTLRVRVDSYGLVNGGNHGSSTSFLAGPAGLASQSASLAAQSGYVGTAATAGGFSQYFPGALDIGNWVLT